ncbi:MAG: hypothetical protein NC337_08180 [Roseburia sp.]|nr:hypothetical protein [Roseburia sp.]
MRNKRTICIGIIILLGLSGTGCASVASETGAQEEAVQDAWAADSAWSESADADSAGEYEGVIANPQALNRKNTQETLNVATYITKVGGTYFIADCYHDQIIYSDTLGAPLTEWRVLTDEVHYAHTIASDGELLVADDTENNRLLVFQRTADGYAHTQTLDNIGLKPHYVQYDAKSRTFLAWSSITGEMYFLKRDGAYLYIEKVLKLEELYGVYVRSFTLTEEGICFVSGHNNQKIIRTALSESGEAFEIVETYAVPDALAGMVQLTRIQDYYYITVSTDNRENQDFATIVRCKELGGLADGAYEDVYAAFGISGGTPYYITQIDGRYYMAHHRTAENIIAFDVVDNEICNVETLY